MLALDRLVRASVVRGARARAKRCPARARALGGDADETSARAARVALPALLTAGAVFSTSAARARGSAPSFACDGAYVESSSGLKFCDVVVGEGASPGANTQIEAHYTGRLENGSVFDSSYERGSPLKFKASQVIKGWGIGILGDGESVPAMKAGGRRKLVIPADLGYGARGAGGVIPGGATLYFDVELVRVL